MANKRTIEIIIEAVDKASGTLKNIGGALGNFGKSSFDVAKKIYGYGAAATGAGVLLANSAAKVESLQYTFDNLANSIGEDSVTMMDKLKSATSGMVSEQNLLTASNKFVSMGLAGSAEEAAKLAEMSTQLGMAMGGSATDSMENFALMLANQSILRLDSFGISSGVVRERIDELTASNANLTSEQAFMQAVMEQGAVAMERVGNQSETAAASGAKFQAMLSDLQIEIGEALMPVLGALMEIAVPLIEALKPLIESVFGQLARLLTTSVIPSLVNLIPTFMQIIQAILPLVINVLPPLFKIFEALIPVILELINSFMPIIQMILPTMIGLVASLASWLSSKLIPVIQSLGDWLGKALPVAFKFLSDLWKNTLQPALQGLWTFLTKVWEAFVKIGEAVKKVIQFFKDLVAGIKNIKLPDWLTPGSPTPFEIGLRGIADALQDVNGITANTFGGLPEQSVIGPVPIGQSAGMGLALTVNINSAVNLADRAYAERELMPYIEAGVRQLLARAA